MENETPQGEVDTQISKDEPADLSAVEKVNNDNDGDVLKADDSEISWESELIKEMKTEFTNVPKKDYINICNQSHRCLQRLLAEEMTGAYANFALLFKRFRLIYAQNRKLLGKVLERDTSERFLDIENRKLLEKLDIKVAQEKELQSTYESIRNSIAELSNQKNAIERERDELKELLALIPEEIIKAAGDYSLAAASEEKKHLELQLQELRDKFSLAEVDLEHAHQREDMFRKKFQELKSVQSDLMEEIVRTKREAMIQMQTRGSVDASVSEKNDEIRRARSVIDALKNNVENLEKDVEREKRAHAKIFTELMSQNRTLGIYERKIKQLKNELSARHFQLTTLRLRKENLEFDVQKSSYDIHSLKIENSKVTKERSLLERKVSILEEELKEVKADHEVSLQTIKNQISEIENLEKDKQHAENDYKEAMRHMMKIDHEFRLLRGANRKIEAEMKLLEKNRELVSKELDDRVHQIVDLENAIAQSREEKNGLIRDIKDLGATVTESKETIKALEQRCIAYDGEILQHQEQIQAEEEKYKHLTDMHREVTSQLRHAREELVDTIDTNRMISQRNKSQILQINSLQKRQSKIEKEFSGLKTEVRNAQSAQARQEAIAHNLSQELGHKERERVALLKGVSEKKMELEAVRREAKNLTSERDFLKTQIFEKDKELRVKAETNRLLGQESSKANQTLQEQIKDMKLLKQEIESLRRTEAVLRNRNVIVQNLKLELNGIHQELVEEKLKSKIMEEFQTPQNVHRWRILEAEDPTRAHLVARNLKFQKDLLKKTDQLRIKEQELKDKNRQIMELRQDLQKLSNAKSGDNTWLFRKELQQCKERMKCLTAETSMYESLTSKQQIENKELKEEIKRLKVLAIQKKLSPKNT